MSSGRLPIGTWPRKLPKNRPKSVVCLSRPFLPRHGTMRFDAVRLSAISKALVTHLKSSSADGPCSNVCDHKGIHWEEVPLDRGDLQVKWQDALWPQIALLGQLAV